MQILVDLDVNTITDEKLDELVTVAYAQVQYLRTEQTALMIKAEHGKRIGNFFRQLENNTSAFPESSIENVRTAVQLAGGSNHYHKRGNQNQNQFQRGTGRGQRGRSNSFRQFTDRQISGYRNNHPRDDQIPGTDD